LLKQTALAIKVQWLWKLNQIKRRWPPSSELSLKTACAVVPEPAKKSKTKSLLPASVPTLSIRSSSFTGLVCRTAPARQKEARSSFFAASL
jgi:hypothetical protein